MEVRVVDHPLAAARLTWSDTSSKSARPAKDFESWETVSITEARSVPSFDVQRNFLNDESTRMDTNREMKLSASGEHRPLACWRRLPAVAHFTAMLSATDSRHGSETQ